MIERKTFQTQVKILFNGGIYYLYTNTSADNLIDAAKESPETIALSALKDGSLFFGDYKDTLNIHYLFSRPEVEIKLWENEEDQPSRHECFGYPK